MGDNSDAVHDTMAAPSKIEEPPEVEHTPSSIESTPEVEAIPADASNEQSTLPQKRKGGRKPVSLAYSASTLSRLDHGIDALRV